MNHNFSAPLSHPIVLDRSVLAQTYALVAIALALTAVGVFVGMTFAAPLLTSGWLILLLFAELGIVLTANWWMHSSPLNYLLFGTLPFLIGMTLTPYLALILAGYANGSAIIFNAVIATTLLTAAAGIFGATTSINLGVFARAMFFSLIGLLIFMILQIFVPALRTGMMEVLASGFGIVLFAGFLAYDVQRIAAMSRLNASPFLMALSLYLDIYNLFLFILRFMIAISGNRR